MKPAFERGNRQVALSVADRKDEIEATALQLQTCMFYSAPTGANDLSKQTFLYNMYRQGKLTHVMVNAVERVLYDFDRAAGVSGGVTMAWSDKIDRSATTPTTPSNFKTACSNDAQDRLKLLIDEALTPQEKALFIDVFVYDYFRRWGGARVQEMGWMLSGYKGQNESRIACVVRTQALLERIASYYRDQ